MSSCKKAWKCWGRAEVRVSLAYEAHVEQETQAEGRAATEVLVQGSGHILATTGDPCSWSIAIKRKVARDVARSVVKADDIWP